MNNLLHKIFLLPAILLAMSGYQYAATITSSASGNWNSSSTWTGGIIPGINDDVIIAVGHTITVAQNTSCNSIIFSNSNTTGTGTINVNTGIVLDITASLNAPGPSVSVKISGSYNLAGSGKINCGSLNVGNSQSPGGSGTTTVYLTSTIDSIYVSGNVTLTATYTSTGNKYNNPFLDLQSGVIKVSGQIVSDNKQSGAISTITSRNGLQSGTLVLENGDPFNFSPIGTTYIYLDGSNTTIDYAGQGTQVVYPTTYNNLKLSGSGDKTTTGITVNGKFVVYGDISVSDPPSYGSSADIEYSGAEAITTGDELPATLGSLTINNSGGVTLNKAINVSDIIIGDNTDNSILNDGGYQISSTGTLDLVSGEINFGSPSGNTAYPSFATSNIGSGTTVGYLGSGNQTVDNSITYSNLTIGGSGVKTTAGVTVNKVLKIQGSATVSVQPSFGPLYKIEYNGTGNQSSGVELPDNIRYLRINNTGGDVSLTKEITVSDTLEMVSGNLKHSNGLQINLGTSALLTGESSGHAFLGKLRKSENIGTGSSSGLLNSLGLDISSGDDFGTITVTRISGATPLTFENCIKRSWEFTSDKSPSTGRDITFTWVSSEDNSIDLTKAIVYYSTDGGDNWLTLSDPSGTDVSGTREISASGVLPGMIITVGDLSVPMPVELTAFKAVISGKEIKLNWNTETEIENYGFEIERMVLSSKFPETGLQSAKTNWKKIGFVKGNGSSNTVNNYNFTDKPEIAGRYSYRLKQIDINGLFNYSEEISVAVEESDIVISEFSLEQNYPNPFNPETTIKYTLSEGDKLYPTTLKIYNLIGQEVAVLVNEQQAAGNHEVKFNGSSLSSGIYLYKLESGGNKSVKKFILLK